MAGKTQALLSDKLLRSSGLMFAAFMVSNVFSYLFQVVMGRLLGPAQYGFLNALLSVMVVLSIPVATLLMVVSRRAADYKAREDYDGVRGLFQQVNKAVLLSGCAGLAIFLLGAGIVSDYLRSPSLLPVMLTGLAAFASLTVPINTAFLQGLQDYRWFGISTGLAGPAKFFFCALLVLLGFGVNGALGGLILTSVFMWSLTYFPLKKYLSQGRSPHSAGHISLKQIMPVFLANVAFTVMTQADIVLANRYFQPHQAGVYASAAILGRAVMYIPASIVLAMFPMVSEKKALNKASGHLLAKSLLATCCLSGTGVILFYFFPEWTMATFFGDSYAEAAGLLKYFGLAMLPMAFLLVLMNYLVAKEKSLFAYIMIAGAALEIGAMSLYHGTPMDILNIMGVVGSLTLAVSILAHWAPELLKRRASAA